jgi:phage/plasmid-associated DNA primase
MLHALKEQEDWQIIPFLKGRGGSGKSTVATVIKNFYEAADVGILSNNSEKKFGLQALLDKFVWLCLELKRNIALDQAEFQSMVSGEDMMIAQKNHIAKQVTWSAPGLLCGNESPSWVDAQGSIARRMAIITFSYSLQERDVVPDLLKKILLQELPALIVKCNEAYRMTCETSRHDDIWKVLPQYFKNERLKFQKDTDAVYAAVFDTTRFDLWSARPNQSEPYEAYYIASSTIEEAYRHKWRELMGNLFAEPFTAEKYAAAYQSAGIDGPIHGTRTCPELQTEVEDNWCVGIRQVRRRPQR